MLSWKGVAGLRSYYIFKAGKISRKENTVFLEYTDKETGKPQKRVIPIHDIEQIYFFKDVSLNTKFMEFVSKRGILLHFYNYYGKYVGSFYPKGKNEDGKALVKQVEHYLAIRKRLYIAKEIVMGALYNIKRFLAKKSNNPFIESTIETSIKQVEKSDSINEIMGYEASARKAYYSAWNGIIKWNFPARKMHPPADEVNALISFGNSLLYTKLLHNILSSPLNPSVSYLHETYDKNRFPLSYDISEVFKPIIVDRIIFKLINKDMLKKEQHFIKEGDGTYLNDEGRKIFIKEFEDTLSSTIIYKGKERKISYSTLLRYEVSKLYQHIMDKARYTALRAWW